MHVSLIFLPQLPSPSQLPPDLDIAVVQLV